MLLNVLSTSLKALPPWTQLPNMSLGLSHPTVPTDPQSTMPITHQTGVLSILPNLRRIRFQQNAPHPT